MRKLLLIFAIACAVPCAAQTCNPGNVTGCATSFPGAQGSTTPTAFTGTGYTTNGVTTASIDTIWGVEYNHGKCPYNTPTGDCTINYFFPHGAQASANKIELVMVDHGGGGSAGNAYTSDGFANGTGCCQSSILWVQKFLGTPNANGGVGLAIVQINYELTAVNGGTGQNPFPTQWQDAKCALWTIEASPSIFPGAAGPVIGMYGPSWGGNMVFWAGDTPDNAYTTNCPTPAPSAEAQFRIVAAWPAMDWLYSFNGSTLGINSNGAIYDNTFMSAQGTTAGIHAIQSQCNSATESTCQANCAAFSPFPCDPVTTITSGTLSTSRNVAILYQFGTPGNHNQCADMDCLIRAYANVLGFDGSGIAATGNAYTLSAQYTAQQPTIHPFMQILYPNIFHEGDLADTWPNIPSLLDAFNFLMATGQPMVSGGLGGNLG
jgi:hypothetical protein